MKYQNQYKITKQAFDSIKFVDNDIYKQICHKLIDDIPIEELKKVFTFEKLDPFTKQSEELMLDPLTPEHIRQDIIYHKEFGILKFIASINIY